MNDHTTLARGWVLKADSDLADARRTVASDGPYDTACFHAQQAIEKTLKAYLAFHGRPIPRSHDLEEIAALCQQVESLPEIPLAELADATDYAVQIRYDLDAWPSQLEAERALRLAEQIRTIILSRIPQIAQV